MVSLSEVTLSFSEGGSQALPFTRCVVQAFSLEGTLVTHGEWLVHGPELRVSMLRDMLATLRHQALRTVADRFLVVDQGGQHVPMFGPPDEWGDDPF